MSKFMDFEDLARENPESAQNAVVAIMRAFGHTRVCLPMAALVAAMEFRLVGETSVDGKSLTFTLEKKGRVL
jgi:hypothetical protein